MAIHPEFQLDGGARQAGLAMTHSMGSFAASSAVLRLPRRARNRARFRAQRSDEAIHLAGSPRPRSSGF